MKYLLSAVLLPLLALVACRKPSFNCDKDCNYTESLLFQTGFQQTSLTDGAYQNALFSGSDSLLTAPNDWAIFSAQENIETVEITYEDGDTSDRYARIVSDSTGNSVLEFRLIEAAISEGSKRKGRVQMNLTTSCLREIYYTVQMRLHSDMAALRDWEEKIDWLTIFEFWNNADWTKEKFPFRVSINLAKAAGAGNPLYVHAAGQQKQNCYACAWKTVWEQAATDFALPFGEWVTWELYLREGDADNGRFYLAVTPQNGSKQILFDIQNYTQHPDETCPDGFTQINPMKLYTSQALVDYLRNQDKQLSIYWDNWQLYRNKSGW